MKYYAAVMTGMFFSLTTFLVLLYGTSCSFGSLFFCMALAFSSGISVVMFVPEKKPVRIHNEPQLYVLRKEDNNVGNQRKGA